VPYKTRNAYEDCVQLNACTDSATLPSEALLVQKSDQPVLCWPSLFYATDLGNVILMKGKSRGL